MPGGNRNFKQLGQLNSPFACDGYSGYTDTDITVAVASLTRLTGKFAVKDPKKDFAGLTWTGLDVGGPCLETFGMISESSSPFGQGRPVT